MRFDEGVVKNEVSCTTIVSNYCAEGRSQTLLTKPGVAPLAGVIPRAGVAAREGAPSQ